MLNWLCHLVFASQLPFVRKLPALEDPTQQPHRRDPHIFLALNTYTSLFSLYLRHRWECRALLVADDLLTSVKPCCCIMLLAENSVSSMI